MKRTTIGDPARIPAMTAENVRDAMRSLKVIVEKHWPHGIPLECITNADESDCTPENMDGCGGRVFGEAHTLDKKLSCPVKGTNGRHISFLAFANVKYGLVHLVFNVGGPGSYAVITNSRGEEDIVLPKLKMASVFTSDSGSFKGCGIGKTELGSFGLALKHSVKAVAELQSVPTEKMLVMCDGDLIHSEDKHIGILSELEGVVVVRISAGLTSVLQLCDDGAIFGRIKQQIRMEVQSFAAASGSELGQDEYLQVVENACIGNITGGAMISALTRRGWFVDDGRACITDESIDRLIRDLLAKDIVRPDARRRRGMQLQSPDYLRELQATERIKALLREEHILPLSTTELLKPEVINATRRAAQMIEARYHQQHVKPQPARVVLTDLKKKREGCLQLTDPEVLAHAQKEELEKEQEMKDKMAKKAAPKRSLPCVEPLEDPKPPKSAKRSKFALPLSEMFDYQ